MNRDAGAQAAIRGRRSVIAAHLVLMFYGHWAVNGPRGSGSSAFGDPKFAPLGPLHHGRKPAVRQPTRAELRNFHEQHEELLNFPVFWIDDAKRTKTAAERIAETTKPSTHPTAERW